MSRVPTVGVLLAAVAGFLDAAGYLTLHRVFTAHMTGNASKLGVALGRGHLGEALPFVVVVPLWLAGIAVGTLLVDAGARRVGLLLQAALVGAYMGYGATLVRHGTVPDHTAGGFYVLLAFAAVSLGLQTAAITQYDRGTLRTAYVSGVLTNLTQAAVRRLRGRDESGHRLSLLASIWVAYVAGATASSAGLAAFGIWCLAAPTGALLVAAAALD